MEVAQIQQLTQERKNHPKMGMGWFSARKYFAEKQPRTDPTLVTVILSSVLALRGFVPTAIVLG